jgi:hypothetical protein
MPEDSTRRLLKVFGVSVTECEDAVTTLIASLRDPAAGGPALALEAYAKATRELTQRWAELNRLLADYQIRAQDALAAHLKERGSAGTRAVQ